MSACARFALRQAARLCTRRVRPDWWAKNRVSAKWQREIETTSQRKRSCRSRSARGGCARFRRVARRRLEQRLTAKAKSTSTAAHICAAAPGGPRYDETMSPEERSSANNGIWMCRDHGKAIDPTDSEFTVERLREWKKPAENESMNGRMDLNNASASTGSTSIPSAARPS
jgi:hypothetical protein